MSFVGSCGCGDSLVEAEEEPGLHPPPGVGSLNLSSVFDSRYFTSGVILAPVLMVSNREFNDEPQKVTITEN